MTVCGQWGSGKVGAGVEADCTQHKGTAASTKRGSLFLILHKSTGFGSSSAKKWWDSEVKTDRIWGGVKDEDTKV